jgi:pimeloyl-ACP methyl ester carboxylesterase
MILYL